MVVVGKKIEVDGKTFLSKRDFADTYDISISTIDSRLKRGWSWEQIAHTPIRGRLVEVVCDGKVYEDIHAFATAYNLSVNLIRARRRQGWSWERIASTPVIQKGNSCVYDGVEYKSLSDLAKANGLSEAILLYRLKMGKSLKEAIETPLRTFGLYYEGDYYARIQDLAEKMGVPYSLLRQCLCSCDSVESAIVEAKSRQRKGISYKGKYYKSVSDLAKELGYSPGVLYKRLGIGLTIEEAVDIPLGTSLEQLQALRNEGKSLQAALDILICDWEFCIPILRSQVDISSFKNICNGKFVLITCRVCGKNILLPIQEAIRFVHSDNCERNEWLQ